MVNEKNLQSWIKEAWIAYYDAAYVEAKFLNPLL
jgi:hypothetical protein